MILETAQKIIEDTFIGEHTIKIMTLGMEKDLKISVKNVKCRIESEVARYDIKCRYGGCKYR